MMKAFISVLFLAIFALAGCQSTGKFTPKPERPSPDFENSQKLEPLPKPVKRPSPDFSKF